MKLLFIIPGLSLGGAEKVLTEITNRWVAKYDIHVLTFYPISKDHFNLNEKITRHEIKIAQRRIWDLKSQYKIVQGIKQLSKQIQPHLVVSFLIKANIYTQLALRKTKIPTILCERSIINRTDIPWYTEKLRRALYPSANKIVVLTQYSKIELMKKYPKLDESQIAVIPNSTVQPNDKDAINIRKFFKLDPNTFLVVSLGRLNSIKRFDLLLKIANQLKNQANIQFLLFGEGAERKNLENQIKLYDLQKTVQLAGLTKTPQAVLEQADLYVSTSRFEGFSMALLEAMQASTPIISFDIPSSNELIQDQENGILVEFENVNDFADAIVRLKENPNLVNSLVKNGRNFVENYKPEHVDKLWFNLFNQIQ
jgi:GalNAc-alpha-(1->4)-GalNAc-alpha-(1->3)-diNAcBac-PP-undecaprenol alpha-1,4-N-acetyl-D-galactosaminyltransferase